MARLGKKTGAVLIGGAILSLALTACGGGGSGGGGGGGGDNNIDTSKATGEVSYWLWDNTQQPAYQQCADAFHAKNPNVTVKITQYAYDSYWTKLTNGFVANTAPDVFTDHLSKYPEFVSQDQLVPMDDFLTKDGIKTDIYEPGLADLWVGQDGKRYGLPKDWDTISVFYNKKLVQDAGIKESQLQSMTWNPDDGGTYEKLIAHLTVDKSGKRGDEPGFDKTHVKVYGLGLDGSSGSAPPAGSTPTRTRGEPSTTTTIRISRRPSAGSAA
jgi:multiple sugar transport system substrate-binding protein